MKYLIDTHTFLWFTNGSEEISSIAKSIIENRENDILISIASLWEISIKSALGKLSIKGQFESVIDDVWINNIEIIPINFNHLIIQNNLTFHHKDPFDRLIISQAIVENCNIIGCDCVFDNYLTNRIIKRIW